MQKNPQDKYEPNSIEAKLSRLYHTKHYQVLKNGQDPYSMYSLGQQEQASILYPQLSHLLSAITTPSFFGQLQEISQSPEFKKKIFFQKLQEETNKKHLYLPTEIQVLFEQREVMKKMKTDFGKLRRLCKEMRASALQNHIRFKTLQATLPDLIDEKQKLKEQLKGQYESQMKELKRLFPSQLDLIFKQTFKKIFKNAKEKFGLE